MQFAPVESQVIKTILAHVPESRPDPTSLPAHKESFHPIAYEHTFPRFNAIHGVLAQEFGGSVTVVNNGPNSITAMEAHFVRRGDSVVVRDPEDSRLKEHAKRLNNQVGPEALLRHVRYVGDKTTPNGPNWLDRFNANIVYWANPYPDLFDGSCRLVFDYKGDPDDETEIKAHYLTRDLRPGGYLVFQTDEEDSFDFLDRLNPKCWQRVYDNTMGPRFWGTILPTIHHLKRFWIFKKLPIS